MMITIVPIVFIHLEQKINSKHTKMCIKITTEGTIYKVHTQVMGRESHDESIWAHTGGGGSNLVSTYAF